MSWKKILKEQTTLGDFGMNRGTRQATFPQMERDDTAALQSEMPRIRSKLEADIGRIEFTTPDRQQVDSSTWFLTELDKVKSMENLKAFKALYRKHTNLDI
tara:strand:- start:133 stop:435 length:303 start_codon:yes stop_codon:yes gene_type:complete